MLNSPILSLYYVQATTNTLYTLQVWVKPSAEMSFLYGNHVVKNGLGRITENTPAYTGVVIYSMADIPLGFGVTAKSTSECRAADPNTIVVFHQADVGEYLRAEEDVC
jgi:60S ribosome subunit biogenesis protein NIP7